MAEKRNEPVNYSFHEVQRLVNRKSLVIFSVIVVALAAGVWAWWEDPFTMSVLVMLAALSVIVIIVMLLVRLRIYADREGIFITMGLFTRRPKRIGWEEIESLSFKNIHSTGSLSNIESQLKDGVDVYVCQGLKAVIIERMHASAIVFSLKDPVGFQAILKKFYRHS